MTLRGLHDDVRTKANCASGYTLFMCITFNGSEYFLSSAHFSTLLDILYFKWINVMQINNDYRMTKTNRSNGLKNGKFY